MLLTYGQLRGPLFLQGFRKLSTCSKLNMAVAYNVGKIHERIIEEVEASNVLHQALVEEYAVRDADGALAPYGDEPGTFTIPDDKKAEWVPKYNAFLATTFEVRRPRVELEKVEAAELTPAEISALGGLLSFDDQPFLDDAPPA